MTAKKGHRPELPPVSWAKKPQERGTPSEVEAEPIAAPAVRKDDRRVLTVRLTEELYGRLLQVVTDRRVRREPGRTANDLVVAAIEAYLQTIGA